MRVRDLDGKTWQVGRRWLPWRRRIRHTPDYWDFDLPDVGGLVEDLPGFLGVLVAGIVLVIALPFLLLALTSLLELSLLVALLPVVVVVRVALRRPWTVQVIAPDGALAVAEPVVGWRESGERVAALAAALRERRSAAGEGTDGGEGADGKR
ncbi:MAG TPA: hypothetical protein VFP72_20860 [Kineosporiaceae bacterium]|nr:hypothetical protein [Kineosporiaceae bacterium]